MTATPPAVHSGRRLRWLLLAMLIGAGTASAQDRLAGAVTDASGAPVAGASVTVMTAARIPVAAATTDAQGRFGVPALQAGSYLVIVRKGTLDEARLAVIVGGTVTARADVTLRAASMGEAVTVTGTRGSVERAGRTGQPVTVIAEADIGARATVVVAQAVEQEAGVALQRTSPTMAGVFVRGLVGNKVNMFVDGVRLSNGAQRGGVNTFMDLIEPDSLDSIEILRGPSSDQYGSDALGGSIQFLTKSPALASGRPRVGGSVSVGGGTAHRNGGGAAFGSFMGARVGLTGSVSGRSVGTMRPGGGIDSHAAVTRFFGVPSSAVVDERLPDTGFRQAGGQLRMSYVPDARTQVSTSYMRTRQNGAHRYDQMLGGDGNLIADLNDLGLDLLSARVERFGLGPVRHVSVTYGVNRQSEERVNQGGQGSSVAAIGHEPETTTSQSIAVSGTRGIGARVSLTLGADMQWERFSSAAYNVSPPTGAVSLRRPRVPDQAGYRQGGLYTTVAYDSIPDRLRLVGAWRFGYATYAARRVDAPVSAGVPLWPDDALSVRGAGGRVAAILSPGAGWTVSGLVSRGFRAPHMTDLGTLGLTGSGFEVAAADLRAAGLSGSVGTTSDATAVSTGATVSDVGPETSLNVEASVGVRRPRLRADLTVFVNNLHDNIQKVSLILPPGAAGASLGGTTISAQAPNGAVFVPSSTLPVLVRANFDNARIWGVEQSLTAALPAGLGARMAFTYVRAEDTATHLPPNIEGGTPHPSLALSLRWSRPGGGVFVEPYAVKAWTQTHLSALDLGDRRTGAGRTVASIRSFFNNGARNRGWIGSGMDGLANTVDDTFLATGETLGQITARVLGTATSSSLYTALPGYLAGGVRVGIRSGPHAVTLDLENMGDTNYRGISWGMDAPGRGISLRYAVTF